MATEECFGLKTLLQKAHYLRNKDLKRLYCHIRGISGLIRIKKYMIKFLCYFKILPSFSIRKYEITVNLSICLCPVHLFTLYM